MGFLLLFCGLESHAKLQLISGFRDKGEICPSNEMVDFTHKHPGVLPTVRRAWTHAPLPSGRVGHMLESWTSGRRRLHEGSWVCGRWSWVVVRALERGCRAQWGCNKGSLFVLFVKSHCCLTRKSLGKLFIKKKFLVKLVFLRQWCCSECGHRDVGLYTT